MRHGSHVRERHCPASTISAGASEVERCAAGPDNSNRCVEALGGPIRGHPVEQAARHRRGPHRSPGHPRAGAVSSTHSALRWFMSGR